MFHQRESGELVHFLFGVVAGKFWGMLSHYSPLLPLHCRDPLFFPVIILHLTGHPPSHLYSSSQLPTLHLFSLWKISISTYKILFDILIKMFHINTHNLCKILNNLKWIIHTKIKFSLLILYDFLSSMFLSVQWKSIGFNVVWFPMFKIILLCSTDEIKSFRLLRTWRWINLLIKVQQHFLTIHMDVLLSGNSIWAYKRNNNFI